MMPRSRLVRSSSARVPGFVLALAFISLSASCAVADDAKQHEQPKVGKLPHVSFDAKARQVRVECEALGVDSPLEFFCVKTGGSEHESVLRTPATPSHIHTALLAVGLKPGRPVQYSEALNKWLPPQGPPLHITLEWEKDGKTVSVPAYRCLLDIKTKKEVAPFNWVFAGSREGPDGSFGADVTGYVVSVVNFDYSLIDIPQVASNSNDLLELRRNPEVAPPAKTKVTMVIEPAGHALDGADAPQKDAPAADVPGDTEEKAAEKDDRAAGDDAAVGDAALSDVTVDQARMDALRERWVKAVRPHAAGLREAAQAHYEVITAMRAEQQRLIDEADRLQRAIDALEKEYQDLTTPRPAH
jgi:hypothetical protein